MSEYQSVTDKVNRWNYWTVTRDIQRRTGYNGIAKPFSTNSAYVRARYLIVSVQDTVIFVRYGVADSLEQAE